MKGDLLMREILDVITVNQIKIKLRRTMFVKESKSKFCFFESGLPKFHTF